MPTVTCTNACRPAPEAEWVSDHGEVKEVALWSGALAGHASAARHAIGLRQDARPRRRATLLPGGASLTDADGRRLTPRSR